MDPRFKRYRKKQYAELRPAEPADGQSGHISISQADRRYGSPKPGDMIARNPENHGDEWLVAKAYFEENFELDEP